MHNVADASEDFSLEIGQRLAAVRSAADLTQAQMAKRLGVSLRALASWEIGERTPPIKLLGLLHKEFGTDPIWMLNGPGLKPRAYGVGIEPDELYGAFLLIREAAHEADIVPDFRQEVVMALGACQLLKSMPKDGPKLIKDAIKLGRQR